MRLENGRFLRITELYAFISKDENGHEGIMGFLTDYGTMMPMIGADTDRIDSLRPLADRISKTTGIKYEIRYFGQNKDIK